jgi:hypothetical protein
MIIDLLGGNMVIVLIAGEHSIPIDVGCRCTSSARIWHRGDSELHYTPEVISFPYFNCCLIVSI